MALANKTVVHAQYLGKAEMPSVNCPLNAFMPKKITRPITNPVTREETSDISDLEGKWTFILGDNYLEGSRGYITCEFEATVGDNNLVTFTSTSGEYYPIVGRYNARTHSLSFTRRVVEQQEGNYVCQEPFVYNPDKGEIERKSVVAYFSEYERAVVFKDNMGIALSSYSDRNYKQFNGYYDILDFTICYLPMEGSWNYIGDALFTDGWLIPAIGDETMDNSYKVPVQQNADNENLFRLVNPYKYGPLASTNEATADGYIVFDVSDPTHVMFKLADAGYVNSERGISSFFAYNYMGSLMLINPYYTPEEVIEEFGNEFPSSTFKDGVVCFDSSMTKPDVRFALQSPANSTRYWENENGQPAQFMAGIALPGSASVDGIGVDTDSETEYFTIQGIRVVNPEPGQILIKRTAGKVTKEVIR